MVDNVIGYLHIIKTAGNIIIRYCIDTQFIDIKALVNSSTERFVKAGTAVRDVVDRLLYFAPFFDTQIIYLVEYEPGVNLLLMVGNNIQCASFIIINENRNFIVIIFFDDFLQNIYGMFFADNA